MGNKHEEAFNWNRHPLFYQTCVPTASKYAIRTLFFLQAASGDAKVCEAF